MAPPRCYRGVHALVREGDRILFASRAEERAFRLLVESSAAACSTMPIGVDTTTFAPLDDQERRRVRAHLGFTSDDMVLVCSGRATPHGNIHVLLDVLARLAREWPRVKLVLVGGIAEIPSSRAVVDLRATYGAQLQRTDEWARVMWLGAQSPQSLNRIFGAADVYVDLSLEPEGIGLSQLQAMSAGLPVVLADWGPASGRVRRSRAGLLIPTIVTPNGVIVDHAVAGDVLSRSIADPHRRAAMRNAARRFAVEECAIERSGSAFLDEVEAALARRVRRRGVPNTWTRLGCELAEAFGGRRLDAPERDTLPARFDMPPGLQTALASCFASPRRAWRRENDPALILGHCPIAATAHEIEIGDPLAPRRLRGTRVVHRDIVRYLQLECRAGRRAIIRAVSRRRRSPAAVDRALDELIDAGVVVRSAN